MRSVYGVASKARSASSVRNSGSSAPITRSSRWARLISRLQLSHQQQDTHEDEDQRPPLVKNRTEPRQQAKIREEKEGAHDDEDDGSDAGFEKHGHCPLGGCQSQTSVPRRPLRSRHLSALMRSASRRSASTCSSS